MAGGLGWGEFAWRECEASGVYAIQSDDLNERGGIVRGKEGGFVLAAVLVVIMMASMVAVSLLFRIKAEDTAVAAGNGSEQAWSAAMSGVYEAMRIAAAITPEDTDWQDNPAIFNHRLVFDDGVE